jgi:hypothetical protein
MTFAVDIMKLRQAVCERLGTALSAVSIIPLVLHTALQFNTAVMRRKSGVKPWNFMCVSRMSREKQTDKYVYSVCSSLYGVNKIDYKYKKTALGVPFLHT